MPSPRTLFFLMFFILAGFTYSRGQETVKIRRIEGTIAFDGRPDEEAWSGASPFQLTMHKPDNGSAPSQKTEVMICYDDESVWIGARLFMDNVSKIKGVHLFKTLAAARWNLDMIGWPLFIDIRLSAKNISGRIDEISLFELLEKCLSIHEAIGIVGLEDDQLLSCRGEIVKM